MKNGGHFGQALRCLYTVWRWTNYHLFVCRTPLSGLRNLPQRESLQITPNLANSYVELTECIVLQSLRWRHNERDGVSNHQHHDCLLNLLFRHRSKKTSKLRVIGLCEGNSLLISVNSLHKGPVTRKKIPFDDVNHVLAATYITFADTS